MISAIITFVLWISSYLIPNSGEVVLYYTADQSGFSDNTTYYGGLSFRGWGTSPEDRYRLYIPATGTIKRADWVFDCGVVFSSENVTLIVRKNNTTDYTLSSSVTLTQTTNPGSNTGLSIPITAGDYITFKLVVPTMATNGACGLGISFRMEQ